MAKRFTKLNIDTFVRFQAQKVVEDIANKFSKRIEKEIKDEIYDILQRDPAIVSIRSGDLRSGFGLERAHERAESFVQELVNTIKVTKFKGVRSRTKLGTRVRLTGIPLDFTGIVEKEFAIQVTRKGTRLYWVRWLLFEGYSTIINRHIINYGKIGRSGLPGVMVEGRAGWRVPRKFAGTQNNNFVTRAIKANQIRINKRVKTTLVTSIRATKKKR